MMGYQEAKVISIVNKEILARIDARKRREEIALAGGHREPARRDWVNVPYEQKEEAKRYGCRWCPVEKRWYASNYMSSALVEINLEESRIKNLKKLSRK